MKNFILAAIAFGAMQAAHAQTVPSNNIISYAPGTPPSFRGNIHNSTNGMVLSAGDGTPATGSYVHFFPTNTSNYNDGGGSLSLVSVGNSSAGEGIVLSNYDPQLNMFRRLLVARKDGKVLIGHNIWANYQYPGNYSLYVETGILTERVRVALRTTGDWADYVFGNDYKLLPLNQLGSYVRRNGHLPGVPSAEEMVKQGLDLGSMSAKLLEKIEEQSLYIVQLHEDKTKLETKVQQLEQQAASDRQALQQQLDALKSRLDAGKR
ncbi:hypothetical protein [Flaviaesturariibacter aridisoli]|uniref:BZIP transcription factor n=1 Tax=Flaviaesturariibacter aridisoli TaxID=2545761 RepID=A0A4R4E1K4_9BACT|nr:hypothetical protein [Flaviaesturariibacter aridisoli]TCZ68643.1 hypothetical protein E0486_13575 [Flaviaesturariibacter aridisoli]